MNVAGIIADKRDGRTLEAERIEWLIDAYAKGDVPDYQMSAFAMAVYFQGMDFDETVAMTRAMVESGETMTWTGNRARVDKHSTGGIGDKVSIPLAPLLACAGVDVPMISGRGLGTTGGTLDKLESIRGFRCDLSPDEFRYVVNDCGCAIVSASSNLAVADRKLYALRDVTGTVPSIPLIVASILSKKIAANLNALVLDVKCGSGAFMKSLDDARKLASLTVRVADQLGTATTALITDMNQPLGAMVGNALEIEESLKVLKGDGPDDVVELVLSLGAELLVSCGASQEDRSARMLLQSLIDSGEALEKLGAMVKSQGGDLDAKREIAPRSTVTAGESGYINRINADRIGLAVVEMGGGRKRMGDTIDHSVGLEMLVRIGDPVEPGQPLANIYCNPGQIGVARELVELSFGIVPVLTEVPGLIVERVAL